MDATKILQEAKELQDTIVEHRRYLHTHAETGFNLEQTLEYVRKELQDMGYEPIPCGKAGLIATIQGEEPGKVFLLRGDMDALPITEEADVDFRSQNGCMHACGHDMHTSMLLGAAKLLKEHQKDIKGTIKLMFEPAEEIFEGAKDMIAEGVLQNPSVDAALMIHVMAGMPFAPGSAIVSAPGVSAPAADIFTITVKGKGCHGSMPNTGIDPLNAAAHILISLQEIHARELAMSDSAALTIGSFNAGVAANVIPDEVTMRGSIRSFDQEVHQEIKKRLEEIAVSVGKAFRTEVSISYDSGCPTLVNDKVLCDATAVYTKELLGDTMAFTVEQLNAHSDSKSSSKSSGSEDFAYVSQEVPSVMIALAAGHPEQGYIYPQHHPMVRFDESALPYGSAIYAYTALRWLADH
ncbi:MAG: M20 family metallopeptidase [Lachnospiraceae bacterium]|nr:M20 family metallopeptidase [Lachnospiraceae bacterium]